MNSKLDTPYNRMIAKYTHDGFIDKIPYEVLKEVYDDLVLNLEDLKGLAQLMHTSEHLYIFYRDIMPLTMCYHVVTYLLNTTNKQKKSEYYQYYMEIMEKLSYEINLHNYINT